MHPNLVNYAVSYAKHGFSVIPIGNSKRPLIKFANRPALSPDDIRRVWHKYPLANIALKTDSFFVIDVDRHEGGDGLESIKNLNHNEWFHGTLTERTAHNGFHFFFAKPAGSKIQQNIGFLPNVDIKAHVNNYVVVAPSQLGKKHYKWLNHCPMREPPAGLLKLIMKKQVQNQPITAMQSYNPKGRSRTSELFEEIVNGLGPTGGRNDALAAFVGGLLFRNVSPDVAAELAALANQNTPDKLPNKEVERTVNSMINKEIKRREALKA